MKLINKIEKHKFIKEILKDEKVILGDKKINITDIKLPNLNFDELQYYVHKVGFYTLYFIKLCKQLTCAVELLSNFNYNAKSKYNRIDHLIYSIENYIIRFQSVNDRVLQIINSVFHLNVHENKVTYDNIMTNYKVSRTDIIKKYKSIKKYLRKTYGDNRNTILHRHSYLEKELRKIEIFYSLDDNKLKEEGRKFRTQKLKEYLQNKKTEFNNNNEELFKLIIDFFDNLLTIYQNEKIKLELITGRKNNFA